MTTTTITLAPDTDEIEGGWQVSTQHGCRVVLKRRNDDAHGYAVFSGGSTDDKRVPELGYPGSWKPTPEAAINWARTAVS
jgi:hypothetical protein